MIRPSKEDTTIRSTIEARAMLGRLALRLYENYPYAHSRLKIRGPSIKVALDYLIYVAVYMNDELDMKYIIDKNIYAQIKKEAKRTDEHGLEIQS